MASEYSSSVSGNLLGGLRWVMLLGKGRTPCRREMFAWEPGRPLPRSGFEQNFFSTSCLRRLPYDSHSRVSAQLICRAVSLNCCCLSQGQGNNCDTHTLAMRVLGLVSVFIWSYHLFVFAMLFYSIRCLSLNSTMSLALSLDYYPNPKKKKKIKNAQSACRLVPRQNVPA